MRLLAVDTVVSDGCDTVNACRQQADMCRGSGEGRCHRPVMSICLLNSYILGLFCEFYSNYIEVLFHLILH